MYSSRHPECLNFEGTDKAKQYQNHSECTKRALSIVIPSHGLSILLFPMENQSIKTKNANQVWIYLTHIAHSLVCVVPTHSMPFYVQHPILAFQQPSTACCPICISHIPWIPKSKLLTGKHRSCHR